MQVNRWNGAERVNPSMRRKAEACILDYQTAHGKRLFVVQGFRTFAEQTALYAQGRTAPGPIVTGLRRSMHNYGLAVDFAVDAGGGSVDWLEGEDAQRLGHIARSHGLVWGGDWHNPDTPHVQIIATAAQWKVLQVWNDVGSDDPDPGTPEEISALGALWQVLQEDGYIPA